MNGNKTDGMKKFENIIKIECSGDEMIVWVDDHNNTVAGDTIEGLKKHALKQGYSRIRFATPFMLHTNTGEMIYYAKFRSFSSMGVDVNLNSNRCDIERYSIVKNTYDAENASNRTIDKLYLFSQIVGGGVNYTSFTDIFSSPRYVGEIVADCENSSEKPKIGIIDSITSNEETKVVEFDGYFDGYLPNRGCYVEGYDIFGGIRKRHSKNDTETPYDIYKKTEVKSFNRLRTSISRHAGVNHSYVDFGGVLFYDIDAKSREKALILKKELHYLLSSYEQYHSIRFSTSGDGIHVFFVVNTFDVIWDRIQNSFNEYIFFTEEEKELLYKFYFDYAAQRFGMAVNEALMALFYTGVISDFKEVTGKENIVNKYVKNPDNLHQLVDAVSYQLTRMLLISNDQEPSINPHFKLIDGFSGESVTTTCNNVNLYDEKYIEWTDEIRLDKGWLQLKDVINKIFKFSGYISETNQRHVYANVNKDDYDIKETRVSDDLDMDCLNKIAKKVEKMCVAANIGTNYIPYQNVRVNKLQDDITDNSGTYNTFYVNRWVIPQTIWEFYGDVYSKSDIVMLSAAACNKMGEYTMFGGFLDSSLRRTNGFNGGSSKRSLIEYLNYVLGDFFNVKLKDSGKEKLSIANRSNTITNFNAIDKNSHSYNSMYRNEVLKQSIKNVYTIDLGVDMYLTQKIDDFINITKENGIYLLDSLTGSGKTRLTQEIAKKHKSLLFAPFKVLQENHYRNENGFRIINGSDSIDDLKLGETAVMTYDKANQISEKHIAKFDYVFIDESHTLGTSSYRDEAINNLNNLLRKGSIHTRCIFTTATPLAEALIFNDVKINVIKVNKPDKREKTANFLLCKTKSDCDTTLIDMLYDKIVENREGKRHRNICFVASNQGEMGVMGGIINPLNEMLVSNKYEPLRYTYYCTEHKETEINRQITDNGDLGEIELIVGTTLILNGLNFFLNKTLEKFPHLEEIKPFYYAYLAPSKGDPNSYENSISSFIAHDLMQFGSRTRDAKTIDLNILFPNEKVSGETYDHGIGHIFDFEFPELEKNDYLQSLAQIYNKGVDIGNTKNIFGEYARKINKAGYLTMDNEGYLNVPNYAPLRYIENHVIDQMCKPYVVAEYLKNEFDFKISLTDCCDVPLDDQKLESISQNKKLLQEIKKENLLLDFQDVVELIDNGHPIVSNYMAFMADKNTSVQILKDSDQKIIIEKDKIYVRVKDTMKLIKLAVLSLSTMKTKNDVVDFFEVDRFTNKKGDITTSLYKTWYTYVFYRYGEHKGTNGNGWNMICEIEKKFTDEGYTKKEIKEITFGYARLINNIYFKVHSKNHNFKDKFQTKKSISMYIDDIINSFLILTPTGEKNNRTLFYNVSFNKEPLNFKDVKDENPVAEMEVELKIFSELFEQVDDVII